MIFGALICRFRGHKWRRLRKMEILRADVTALLDAHPTPGAGAVSICNRCEVLRIIKPRAKKEPQLKVTL